MFQHLIVLGTSYLLGTRICWHYSEQEISGFVLDSLKKKTEEIIGKPLYSIHILTTVSSSWESVVEKDSFFADINKIDNLESFLKLLHDDKEITALDIAKYLLSIKPMSNLKLQKMVYMVYADYLIRTDRSLFSEKILAYQYGPLIREVYEKYRGNGHFPICDEYEESSDKVVVLDDITVPVTLSKILKSDCDEDILKSITSTVKRFDATSARDMVDITHRPGSPWDRVGYKEEITDDLIKQYHSVELL